MEGSLSNSAFLTPRALVLKVLDALHKALLAQMTVGDGRSGPNGYRFEAVLGQSRIGAKEKGARGG